MARPVLSLFLMLLALIAPVVSRAASAAGDGRAEAYASVCEQAALQAAAESGVPPDILTALTLTETGRKLNGRLRPWAWSVNAEGAGNWHDDPRSLLAFAEERVRQGRTNMDLGCFQINYRWHGDQFASLSDMLDPLSNARYAARFVRELYGESGDWRAAAGAFHSKTPQYATKYLARFDQLRAMLNQHGLPAAEPGGVRTAGLRAGGPAAAGPADDTAEPRRRGVRRFWRSDLPRGIPVRAGTSTALPAGQETGMEMYVGPDGRRLAAVDPDIAALDRFVARANGASVDDLPGPPGTDSGADFGADFGTDFGTDDLSGGWSGQTPAALPDDLTTVEVAALPDQPHEVMMLLGAAPGTGAQGGGSLAALADGRVSLLGQPRAPILAGGAQPLPGLPQALFGPPASNSSLWQMAAIE